MHNLTTYSGRKKFYKSREWRSLRQFILMRDPICKKCGLNPSLDVDHIIDLVDDPKKALDPKNLQGLCKKCHFEKTMATRIKNKHHTKEVGIVKHKGYDDWPEEKGLI